MEHTLNGVKQRYGIIGHSAKLENALHTAMRVANTDLTVLITGESGVGKEVFSKVIHNLSARKHNPFIAINCGAIPAGTINSELFGHVKGAFTGATGERKGYFEAVDGGTIFLDEIGEMPADTQAYLLRILETGEFIKVGSSSVQKSDVRVIAATNVNLSEKIKEGKFREDLYYRLNTVPIAVPSLRERSEDIYLLFRKFVLDFSEHYNITPIELEEDARKWLLNYSWPGNIRELKNVAEQLCILSERRKLDAQDLLEVLPHLQQRNLPSSPIHDHIRAEDALQEREILYKLLFEMKSDLSDLKKLVFDLIKDNDLEVSQNTAHNLPRLSAGNDSTKHWQASRNRPDSNFDFTDSTVYYNPDKTHQKGTQNEPDQYHHAEVLDEMISLEDMEKKLIKKALKKYKGKRKTAAEELGISERTLYRKIKQYDIDV